MYEHFLLEIGCGYLRVDNVGRRTLTYANEFLELPEIAAILRKETVEWEIYPDFIDDDEVPFFSIGNNSVFVFNHSLEQVRFPLKGQIFANNLDEFLLSLMTDTEFFVAPNTNH